MKFKLLLGAALLGSALSASAIGYTDGVEYYKAGQYANAHTILQNTYNDPSTDKSMACYYLGQIELLYKRFDDAKKYFEKGLELNPENAYNYVGLGNYELLKGNKKAAEGYFKDAQKKAKKNTEIIVDIARAYYYSNPEDKATLETVNKLLADAHKKSKDKEPSIYILEGDMYFNQGGHLGEAAKAWEMAISFDTDNPEGYVKYANAYRGVNPQYSIQKYEELLSKRPDSALAQRELAEIYYENNFWNKAIDLYGDYMKNPNHFPEDKARYAFILYGTGKYDDALRICDEILAENPTDFSTLRIKMRTLSNQKDWDNAVKVGEQLFAIPDAKFNINDYKNYADALLSDKNYDKALEMYEKTIEFAPDSVDLIKGIARKFYAADQNITAANLLEKVVNKPDADLADLKLYSQYCLFGAADIDPETNKAGRMALADKGIAAIDKVIESVEVNPSDLSIRTRLMFTKYQPDTNPEVIAAAQRVLDELDKNPENKTAGNPNLKLYRQTYQVLYNCYKDNKAKQDEMLKKYNEVDDLIKAAN